MNNGFEHECSEENARLFMMWIRGRGGVAIWESVNLSNPGASWSTPALSKEGKPTTKPTWEAANEPAKIVTDPAKIKVAVPKEVQRFRVAARASARGFSTKLTAGDKRRIQKALTKHGEGAFFRFSYGTLDAVIYVPDAEVPLDVYAKEHGL